MTEQNADIELQAIKQVITSLESLDSNARTRVLSYVFQRLDLKSLPYISQVNPIPLAEHTTLPTSITPSITEHALADIRSLKEQKQPKSDNQMAALVAYYLKEIAPVNDRKDYITGEDVEKYFKQAGFPLPKLIRLTLTNAKNAGYFDGVGSGQYKLNPVGYNLVVHGLPSTSSSSNNRTKKKVKKNTKK